MYGAIFERANVSECNFYAANLTKIETSEYPEFRLGGRGNEIVVITPDSKFLISATEVGRVEIYMLEIKIGEVAARFQGHKKYITSLDVSKD